MHAEQFYYNFQQINKPFIHHVNGFYLILIITLGKKICLWNEKFFIQNEARKKSSSNENYIYSNERTKAISYFSVLNGLGRYSAENIECNCCENLWDVHVCIFSHFILSYSVIQNIIFNLFLCITNRKW